MLDPESVCSLCPGLPLYVGLCRCWWGLSAPAVTVALNRLSVGLAGDLTEPLLWDGPSDVALGGSTDEVRVSSAECLMGAKLDSQRCALITEMVARSRTTASSIMCMRCLQSSDTVLCREKPTLRSV